MKMKTVYSRIATVQTFLWVSGLLFIMSGCSSSDDAAQIIADEFITVSGTITDINGQTESGVGVEAVYSSPGDPLNPSETTGTDGKFSLQVLKNDVFFLRGTKVTFATINSEKGASGVNITGLDIGIPTETEAQAVIDAAFGGATTLLQNKAWLVVDVEDENEEPLGGQTVTSTPAPADFVYTECDGTDAGATTTVPCANRTSPAYIAYFDTAGDANVTVGSDTKVAPLIMGEITFLEYEVVSTPVPSAFDRGKAIYDADCASCHKAGSYDPIGSDSDLAGDGSRLVNNLGSLSSRMTGLVLTDQEIADLTAFLDDPSIL